MTDDEIARRSGWPVAVVYAIRKTESSGKNPHAIRFEPNKMRAARPDLAHKIPYTDSDGAGPSHVDRVRAETDEAAFMRALALDADAAMRATSFGAYQTLGGTLLDLTGLPPREALAAWRSDPDGMSGQLLLRWIKRNPRANAPAMSAPPDFRGLARAYNGLGPNVEHYAGNLLRFYNEFQSAHK